MAEELQHLIDRIQTEAVDEAQKQAEDIISKAKQQAATIVKDAGKEAKDKLEKADRDAEAYTQRSVKTLEQSARDLLITVGQGVENILSDLVADAVEEALSIEVVEKMLLTIAEASATKEGESRIDYLVSPKDEKALVKFFADKYRAKMLKGVELHTDNEIVKGFKISFVEESVYHDFTSEAIAESLSNFLRKDLSEIVHRVAQDTEDGDQKKKK